MKFVFLDIDGVLNSSRSVIVKIGPSIETSEQVKQLAQLHQQDFDMTDEVGLEFGAKFGLQTVDPICVALVNKLFEADPSIGLVLSSSHRRFFCNAKVKFASSEHLRRLKLYLTAMGIKVPSAFFGVTNNGHIRRGEQVDEWLSMAYENGLVDDGDPYVILDDSNDFMDFQPLVCCDPDHGFSFANYAEACKHLGLKEPGVVPL